MSWRRLLGIAVAACSSACHSESTSPAAPAFTLATPRMWSGGTLVIVSPAFAYPPPPEIVFDGTTIDASLVTRVAPDTVLVAGLYGSVGTHSILVRVDGRSQGSRDVQLGGIASTIAVPANLATRALSVGAGSPFLWVEAARGLGVLDLRSPTVPPQLVDSTVDPSCLGAIGSAPGGRAVVADRGCGTLRVRARTGAPDPSDSGPPGFGWHLAAHYPPDNWLLAGGRAIVLATRDSTGVFHQTQWLSGTTVGDLLPSPDGRLVVATSLGGYHTPDVFVFDLEHALLLYEDTLSGFSAAFTPSGDTLAFTRDSIVRLVASRTGQRLATFALRTPGGGPFGRGNFASPLVWDPYRPWLYLFDAGGCPGYSVIDRRTWSVAASTQLQQCAEDNYVFVLGPATSTGWLFRPGGYLATFSIPDP